ncbi:MAG TPA: DUF1569 domain-containing protein [Gemmatimonadales bacterium]|jgi:hypothetical protein|nr:DUF1569 domain-containing protein [Gemmatimonadales bacterium]
MAISLDGLPDLVLGPLAGKSDADWYRAPAGKWNSAQVVEHLAISLEGSGKGFDSRRDKSPMTRRPKTIVERVASFLILTVGWFPPGREAPSGSRPAEQVDRKYAESHFREGIARFNQIAPDLLARRPRDLFVKHPRLGDLTLPEWMRFHLVHCRHHAKQIRERSQA